MTKEYLRDGFALAVLALSFGVGHTLFTGAWGVILGFIAALCLVWVVAFGLVALFDFMGVY